MFSATKGGSPSGYQISRSVRLRSSASAYFSRTPASAGNRKTWTWSGWVKRGIINSSAAVSYPLFAINSANNDSSWFDVRFISDQLYIGAYTLNYRVTTQVFRDPSAWYHIVLAMDTTQATANNRLLLYVNGVQVTAFATTNNPTQNADLAINLAGATYIGFTSANYFDGYLTEVNFIDGQALTPASFGETDTITGVWKPKKYTGTYGTNGFYLNFSDNSAATAAAIGKDYSGNGNNWTPNNISVTSGATYDSMLDVPTPWADGGNGRGNYAVLNPLNVFAGNVPVISNGNLQLLTTTANYGTTLATIGVFTGKFYWEITPTAGTGGFAIGFANASSDLSQYVGQNANSWCYYNNGTKYTNNSSSAYGASFTTNDVIGVALDMDAGTVTFYKNGTTQGQAFSGLAGTLFPAVSDGSTSGTATFVANFGQRPFAYTPPTGFKALNTQNLPEPTIKKGNQYFDVSLYTGTGSALSVTNSGSMQPDLVWIKGRSAAYEHALFDSVRGARNLLRSNATAAEVLETAGTSMTSFDSGGFSLGTNGATASTNVNGSTFVGWQWKEGATQGFDIVTYTGTSGAQNISHSLGVAPAMIITKVRNNAGGNWAVYHKSLGNTGGMWLNLTNAFTTQSLLWNNTSPTSSVFSVGSNNTDTNWNTYNFVSYLFAEVAGFSRAFSYTGNGSTDGSFIWCGFRPRFVLLKRTDTTGNWFMFDTARDQYNVAIQELYANLSNAEAAGTTDLDILSNGFKMRAASAGINASGGTYVGMAFAENPLKYALAR